MLFLFTCMLDSQRGDRNQLVIQQVKVLLESHSEFTALLWIKSRVTSRNWRPQLRRAREKGHHRVALSGGF